MDIDVLAAELASDPLDLGYAALDDAPVADLLNAPSRDGYQPVAASEVRRYVLMNGLWPAIAALAQSSPNPLYQGTAITVMQTLAPNSFDSIRMQEPAVRGAVGAMLQTLVDAGAMTSDQRADLLALGAAQISRAEELGLPQVHHLDVAAARLGA